MRLAQQHIAPCVASQCHQDEKLYSIHNITYRIQFAFQVWFWAVSPANAFLEQKYTMSEAFPAENVIGDKSRYQ